MADTEKKSPTDMCVDKTDCHYQDHRSKPTAETTKDAFRKQKPKHTDENRP